MKYLTNEEINRLLVSIDDKKDKLLIQLGLVTGCRVSEIVGIKLRNIVADRIKIWDEKKNLFREVVIDDETRNMLENYLRYDWKAKRRGHKQLFYFSAKTANRIIKRYFAKAGIPAEKAHWHTLRHTYVVQSLDAGVPLNHICEQTGDSPITVLSIYGKPSIDKRLEMVRLKGRYWEGTI